MIQAAKATGLAFVGITDHNNLDAKPFEGYRDGVLVLVGAELSTPAGHLLGLGLDRDPAWRFNGDGLDALEDVRDLGGVPFAAHPFSARADLRWNGWDLPGPWGIELLNGDSDARRAGPRVLLSVGLYRLNPGYALLQGLRPPDEALRRWDEMLARRDVVGLAGSDAHSRLALTKTRALRFPSYESLFAQARNHVLLGPPPDRRRRGRPRRRRSTPSAGAGSTSGSTPSRRPTGSASRSRARPGSVGPWATTCPGPARAPSSAAACRAGTRVVLLRDGQAVGEGAGSLEVALPGPGVYRVEARLPGWPVPWVITNPVYVHDEATREARRLAAAWPASPPPAREVRALASLDGSAAFDPEFDPSSGVDRASSRPEPGPRAPTR